MTSSHPITRSAAQIARLRMQSLGLVDGTLGTPQLVVGHHLAMQAQDWTASRWAIGSRLHAAGATHARDADVLAAYDSGTLVRSWPMRGTVHVTRSDDLPWMLELMGGKALSGVARRWELLGIDEPWLERARDVATTLLRGGGSCTRGELSAALVGAGLDATGQRLYHTVWYLSQTGTLLQGPTRDGEHLLVLLDEWITAPRRLDRDEALAELGRRYLTARGPAMIEDLAHWTKLGLRDCRAAFAACEPDTIDVCGPCGCYVMLREQHERFDPDLPAAKSAVHVLPAFDEHLLGYRVRDDVLDPAYATLVDPARNGVFRWTIVRGGRVVATWRRTPRSGRVAVDVDPFTTVPASAVPRTRRALKQWAAFRDTRVDIRITGA